MIRLNDIINNESILNRYYGLVIFGALAQNYLEDTKETNNLLEGVCPERIFLCDEWLSENVTAIVKPTNSPHTAYAYYPPEYLSGHKWDATCSVFAVFAITYKILTGELPYIGNIPEELLTSEEGVKYIEKKRQDEILNVEKIPDAFREFMKRGLKLKREERVRTLGDIAEEYNELSDKFHNDNCTDDTSNIDETCDSSEYELNNIFTRSSFDYILNVQKAESGNLDTLVGLSEQKRIFRNGVLAIINNPEKAKKYKLAFPNGFILYGPPGCGKTYFAKMLAAESQMNYAIINAQDIASTWVHGTQKLIKQMFEQAAAHAPIILIFDEIETMVPNRNHPDNIKVAEDTNAFLSEFNTCSERGILVVGTTNRPQFMDSAILRSGRFDKKIYFPLPDEQTRTEMFRSYLQDRPIKGDVDYQRLGALTSSGYISSDIRLICDEAATRAFCKDIQITQELLEQVIHEGGPSVSQKELKTYEESRIFMEPAARSARLVNHIGFR